MKDKDVGALWRRWHRYPGTFTGREVLPLVRKLVAERAEVITRELWEVNDYTEGSLPARIKENIPKALEEFGIDPATWPSDTSDTASPA
jgi:hypothetical protein